MRYHSNFEIKKNNIKRGTKKIQNFVKKEQKMRYKKCKENKKHDTLENFLKQVKKGPYYVCRISHRSVYQRSVKNKFFEHETLFAELYHPARSFDETLYIGETWNIGHAKQPAKKMALGSIPDEIKFFLKKEKVLISNRFLFKKIAVMYGKVNFL